MAPSLKTHSLFLFLKILFSPLSLNTWPLDNYVSGVVNLSTLDLQS